MARDNREQLLKRIHELEVRVEEAEETLRAIRSGEVDALVATGPEGDAVYTLRSADEGYRVMVQQMSEGAATLTPEGLVLFANDQFAAMLGVPLERVIGSRIQNFVGPEDAGAFEAVLSLHDGARLELHLMRSDGSAVPVYLSAGWLRFDNTECIALVVTDLTEQKRNEQIVAAEKLARSILEQAAVAILVLDPNGRTIQASRAAEKLAGATVLLRDFSSVFPLRTDSDSRDLDFPEILAMVRREGSIAGVQAIARIPGGRAAHVIINAAPLVGPDSEILGCVIVLSDITELMRAESALRESESRLRTLGDNLPDGALYRYCRDTEGKGWLEFVSAGIERLTGVPAAEAMRAVGAVDRTMVPEDLERMRAATAESWERLTLFELEVRHTHQVTGELRWSLFRSMPSRRADGSTVWDGIQLDVTDRKRAEEDLRLKEEQLRQAQKMESIGVLAGGIAHDFNNLLTGVLGNASLILENMPSWDLNRPLIDGLMESANRAADLTRQLLAYAGKGRFFVQKVSVSRSVREMLDLLRAAVPSSIQIHLDLDDGITAVEGDAGQIEQIVMNLVLNASEAIGDRSGSIEIKTHLRGVDETMISQAGLEVPPGTYACLEVRDTGPGMDEATMARIFEPFFTTKFAGRGLGLAAVHGIVRAHRGAIHAYSKPSRGAIFTVLLPVSAGKVSPRAEMPAVAEDLRGHGTILVVDDENVMRTVAKTTLERFGYDVLLAQNGVEALDVFRQAADRIALVLLDLTMPLMGGEETFEKLRAMRPDLPVLMSSGYNQVEVIQRFKGQGPAGFVGKPYTAAELAAKVKAVFSGGGRT
jgi:PAS domain S-box-containing protein